MFKASIEEYKLLKVDIIEIKQCITRYVGYIIGSNGVAFLIFGYLKRGETGSMAFSDTTVLIIQCFIITSLYYVLVYKFKSHNRYVGYTQLLSNEALHYSIEQRDEEISFTESLDVNSGSDPINMESISYSIFTWDSLMNFWNSRTSPKSYPKGYYDKLDFRFILPKGRSYSDVGEFDGKNPIQLFIENILWRVNFQSQGSTRKLYAKFKSKSWNYPFHLLILSIIPVIVAVIFILMGNDQIGFKVIVLVILLACWVYNIMATLAVLNGQHTIDYMSWAFLSFRVKMLNNYGVRPFYYSLHFNRYFKSLILLKKIKEIIDSAERTELVKQGYFEGFNVKELEKKILFGLKVSDEEKKFLKKIRRDYFKNSL